MKKAKHYTKQISLHILFIAIIIVSFIPILYALQVSLSGKGSALSSSLSLIPENFTFANYKAILTEHPFMRWFANSLILSIGTVVLSMATAIPAAYVFSRMRWKSRNAILKSLIILNAFPQVLSLFALFRVLKTMGMLNKFSGLIMIYAGSMCVFAIWNLKGYFDSIPVEIEEAARIDGAGDFMLVVRIVLPLALPAIMVTAVMVLITVWNEYLFATTFLLDNSSYSLAGGLYQLQSNDYSRSWPVFTAASILASIPLLLVFFSIQKYMISGLTAGGVKG